MPNDTAVSDLIGVMALIAVFVTAAAIAGVALLSYPPGDAAPAMIARSVTDESGSTYIYHDGGDPLEWGHFAILVDGGEWTENFSLVDASGIEYEPGTWTTWETGEVLVYNKTPLGKGAPRIQIVGEGVGRTGSDWLLHEIGNGTPTAPTQVPPTAAFTTNVTEGNAPLAVQFTDRSTNSPTSWFWTFGDGTGSTDKDPSHTYTSPGNYTVKLRAMNATGSGSMIKIGYITVSPGIFSQSVADIPAIPGSSFESLPAPILDKVAGKPAPLSSTIHEAAPPLLGAGGG